MSYEEVRLGNSFVINFKCKSRESLCFQTNKQLIMEEVEGSQQRWLCTIWSTFQWNYRVNMLLLSDWMGHFVEWPSWKLDSARQCKPLHRWCHRLRALELNNQWLNMYLSSNGYQYVYDNRTKWHAWSTLTCTNTCTHQENKNITNYL